jgi:hypothetical protein
MTISSPSWMLHRSKVEELEGEPVYTRGGGGMHFHVSSHTDIWNLPSLNLQVPG